MKSINELKQLIELESYHFETNHGDIDFYITDVRVKMIKVLEIPTIFFFLYAPWSDVFYCALSSYDIKDKTKENVLASFISGLETDKDSARTKKFLSLLICDRSEKWITNHGM